MADASPAMPGRVAIVLFNLGGPDKPSSVQPFLRNLFSDPAIIGLPAILRLPLARFIAARRAKLAIDIYGKIGGGSPLLANTQAQAAALEKALGPGHRCFIAMRYWHPLAAETIAEVAAWKPDSVVLLPLYPQFSTTSSGSSLKQWMAVAARHDLDAQSRIVCCYPRESGLVAAIVAEIAPVLDAAAIGHARPPRLLLTAHGLPKRVVAAGDPYQQQVEMTAAMIVAALGKPELDWRLSYQSRVGPLEWLQPSTDAEVIAAGRDGVPLVVAPIAFVSEHSETLVELDIEYRHLAEESGVPAYHRVPTVGTNTDFIGALARLVRLALSGSGTMSGEECRICPAGFAQCALANG